MNTTSTNETTEAVKFHMTGKDYADKHLTVKQGMDMGWVIDSIDNGALLVCPRCEFLHLPALPLPLGISSGPPPVDACDVCAHAFPETDIVDTISAELLMGAQRGLSEARADRAWLFYDLWLGAALAANTLIMARLGDALAAIREDVRRQ